MPSPALLLAATLLLSPALPAQPARQTPPARLSETGLWADPATRQPAAGVMAFEPAHALWSDGAAKQRWLRLPPGARIDVRNPDAWQFPIGTRLWKEFRHADRVETRFMQRGPDGAWQFATYRWRADGSDADLAPAAGQTLEAVPGAPGDGRYRLPARTDCLACHAGARSPVLGFSALQLAPRLPEFMQRGLLRGAPAAWAAQAPEAPGISPTTAPAERAARGYLHANCAHCHHPQGVPKPLNLALSLGAPAPPAPELAELLRRMGTRNPYVQMPPLGTAHIDPQGLALVKAWLQAGPGAANTPSESHHAR